LSVIISGGIGLWVDDDEQRFQTLDGNPEIIRIGKLLEVLERLHVGVTGIERRQQRNKLLGYAIWNDGPTAVVSPKRQ
jgi:hypothetical protein